MLSFSVTVFLAIVLSTVVQLSNIKDTAKDKIKKWHQHAKDFFFDKRSSYFFQEPDESAVLENYNKLYSNMNRQEKREVYVNLGRIAFYSRTAKDLLRDPRTRLFGNTYTKFPVPHLKNLNPILEQACTYDFKNCSESAGKVVSNTFWFKTLFFNLAGKMDKVAGDDERKKRLIWKNITENLFRLFRTPFSDLNNQFEFTTSLSYYFCWFTMLQLPILAHLPYCDHTLSWYSGFAGENIMMEDWEMIDVMDEEPFRCAKFSFCPDPCCFRHSMIQPECDEDQLNPCKNLLHKQCLMKPEENKNFVKLIQNEFNKSCNCNTPGFEYEPYAHQCFDEDECETDGNLCPEPYTVCLNTVGNYSCPCRGGYFKQNNTSSCEPSPKMTDVKRQNTQSGGHPIPISVTSLLIIFGIFPLCILFC